MASCGGSVVQRLHSVPKVSQRRDSQIARQSVPTPENSYQQDPHRGRRDDGNHNERVSATPHRSAPPTVQGTSNPALGDSRAHSAAAVVTPTTKSAGRATSVRRGRTDHTII